MHAVKDNLGKRVARKRKTSAIRGPRGCHLGGSRLRHQGAGPRTSPNRGPWQAGGGQEGPQREAAAGGARGAGRLVQGSLPWPEGSTPVAGTGHPWPCPSHPFAVSATQRWHRAGARLCAWPGRQRDGVRAKLETRPRCPEVPSGGPPSSRKAPPLAVTPESGRGRRASGCGG